MRLASYTRAEAELESLVTANSSVIMYKSELANVLRNVGREMFRNGETDRR